MEVSSEPQTLRKSRPPSESARTGCRFIPLRKHSGRDGGSTVERTSVGQVSSSDERTRKEFSQVLAEELFDTPLQSKVLKFGRPPLHPVSPVGAFQTNLRASYLTNCTAAAAGRRTQRYISQSPERILDAPELVNDFYLNLLDWSCDNILAVGLGAGVYLWNASNGNIQELVQLKGLDSTGAANCVTSLSWARHGTMLAVGTSTAEIQLWDTKALARVRSIKSHSARVSSMSWNETCLSSGGRDSLIVNHDVRAATPTCALLKSHRSEVCGLAWSPDGTQLASGGNDNMLYIWDVTHRVPRISCDAHSAAVKALAWCPFARNVLASGGGTADRTLRLWDASSGTLTNSVDTRSQVCAVLWSRRDKELLSSHGFSDNQLVLWRYSSLAPIAELTGHTDRVLNLAQSPDGATVVSLAADETLRFWRVFRPSQQPSQDTRAHGIYSTLNIR